MQLYFLLQMNDIIVTVRDSNLKLTLAFGIGMHHAGLHERDRKTVEELFVNCKIQVHVFFLNPAIMSFTWNFKSWLFVTYTPLIFPFVSGSYCHKHISLGCKFSGSFSNC